MQINDCKRVRKLHFVGIGGAGMSGIAEVLHDNGFVVSGSDTGESQVIDYLKGLGIKVFSKHEASRYDESAPQARQGLSEEFQGEEGCHYGQQRQDHHQGNGEGRSFAEIQHPRHRR